MHDSYTPASIYDTPARLDMVCDIAAVVYVCLRVSARLRRDGLVAGRVSARLPRVYLDTVNGWLCCVVAYPRDVSAIDLL